MSVISILEDIKEIALNELQEDDKDYIIEIIDLCSGSCFKLNLDQLIYDYINYWEAPIIIRKMKISYKVKNELIMLWKRFAHILYEYITNK